MRVLKFKNALSEGLMQSMDNNPDIFVTGIAVDYPSGIFGSTVEIAHKYGPDRVFDSPAMENAMTGIMIGAASMGKRPVMIHPRCDFMFLALDQLINLAAKWKYMFGGNAGIVPILVKGIIGRGWGQGATHSQSIQSIIAHFPGLNVVMPATPQDAKTLTISALHSDKPTIMLEHRLLYETEGIVSESFDIEDIGISEVVKEGRDVTVIASSYMVLEALAASKEINEISFEVINLRSIRPLDESTILESVKKTGRLIVADTSWEMYGVASEVSALVAEKAFKYLKSPIIRIANADCPAPVSKTLEEAFYPGATIIANAAIKLMGLNDYDNINSIDIKSKFKGPY